MSATINNSYLKPTIPVLTKVQNILYLYKSVKNCFEIPRTTFIKADIKITGMTKLEKRNHQML